MSQDQTKPYYEETDDITDYWQRRHVEWLAQPNWGTFSNKHDWFHHRFGHLLKDLRGTPYSLFDPAASHVLDYGCGVGLYAKPLLSYYDYYEGFDTSSAAIETAYIYHRDHLTEDEKLRVNFSVYTGEIGGWTIPPDFAGYDLVLSITVLQHQPIPRRLAMVENIKRLIKPGGMYIGLEWADAYSRAYDMPPIPEEDWRTAWLPLTIERDILPSEPQSRMDNVWVAR